MTENRKLWYNINWRLGSSFGFHRTFVSVETFDKWLLWHKTQSPKASLLFSEKSVIYKVFLNSYFHAKLHVLSNTNILTKDWTDASRLSGKVIVLIACKSSKQESTVAVRVLYVLYGELCILQNWISLMTLNE